MALSMGYGLVQEQRMKLAMTPELRQAIQVLQFSSMDLIQYIQEQAVENPVLEMDAPIREAEIGSPSSMTSEQLADWGSYIRGSGSPRLAAVTRDEDDSHPVDRIADSDPGLVGMLEEQLRYLSLNRKTKEICRYIIGNLEEDGYLRIDLSELCKRFNITEDVCERALKIVQTLDPAGVGARNLEECLTLQLSRNGVSDPVIYRIVQFYLKDLAEGRYKKVAKVLDCSVEEVQAAADRIRRLNPRPGQTCHGGSPRYVYPDVTVRERSGEYEVLVNESYMPRLGISTHYERLLRDQETGRGAAAYIKDRIQSAMWLLKSIEQRRQTLYRVTRAIVDHQRDFFQHGVSQLKPLTLKAISEELDLHESTVSRATRDKYLQTPRGLFPFRFFFPSGVSSFYGGDTSARSVKDQLARIIEKEDKCKPLSDQKIADQLKEDGIRISRRTVAKYREEMGIASSQVRRRFDG